MSSNASLTPSLAVSRSTYCPVCVKVAVVPGEVAFANVTEPGPLTSDHSALNGPLSVTMPLKAAELESVIVRSGPALTAGGGFVEGVALASLENSEMLLKKSTALTA